MHDSVTMNMIAGILEAYADSSLLKDGGRPITGTFILDGARDSYRSDTLYICMASDINALCAPGAVPPNIACIGDEPVRDDILNDASASFIIIRAPFEIMELHDKINSYLSKYYSLCRWYIKLNNMLISDKGLQNIINESSSFFGNPIIVQDSSFKLLCHTKDYEVDEWVWNEIVGMKSTPHKIVSHIKDGEFAKVYNSSNPVYIAKDEYIPNDTLGCRIDVSGKPIGHVSLIGYSTPINPEDGEFLKILSDVISQQLQKSGLTQFTGGSAYENFFTDLLDGKLTDKLSIENQIKNIGFVFKDFLHVLTVRNAPETRDRIPFFYIRELLNNEIVNCKSVIYNDGIMVLISTNRDSHLPASRLEVIEALLKEHRLVGGLSRCFKNISGLSIYYSQAVKAIEYGLRFNKHNAIFFYDDYFINDVIGAATKSIDYKTLCKPLLFRLIDYDNANNTDFTNSLYIYLRCGSDLGKSAELLKLHRNSMDYRIKKIQDLFNFNLSNPEVIFSLMFSFKILIHHGEFVPAMTGA